MLRKNTEEKVFMGELDAEVDRIMDKRNSVASLLKYVKHVTLLDQKQSI